MRLLIAVFLADQQWHDYSALREELGLPPAVLSKQLATLRIAGYLTTRPTTDGRRSAWRLSDRGRDQLLSHLAGWQRLIGAASKAVAAARANDCR
ncbi:transcriptional regulator [Amycolatopsis jiangsuensis]|uniref:DNA-binding HxlR family transcriptional regulator n=1 Tax=Amycolatopsis jiangsuensis TaxID=1181879 RepID=A0A840INK1_9PSEU|nr:transcriptional regulator [Amycolatopsis jiangsuensis]MBB4683946.1 DNA-binding HxlR family transcriptional regulator [Amycolatopsis jiangsuensis]MBB4684543.1 DNA-binding HxlR family transcriptional regulator [Amycolatopsis jiangsuensis]